MRSCHNSYSLRLRRVLFESLRQMLLWTMLKQAALHIDRLKIKLPTLSIVSHRSYTTVVTLLDVRQHRLGSEETCLVLVYVIVLVFVMLFFWVCCRAPRLYWDNVDSPGSARGSSEGPKPQIQRRTSVPCPRCPCRWMARSHYASWSPQGSTRPGGSCWWKSWS